MSDSYISSVPHSILIMDIPLFSVGAGEFGLSWAGRWDLSIKAHMLDFQFIVQFLVVMETGAAARL